MRTLEQVKSDLDIVAKTSPFDYKRYHQLAREYTSTYLNDKHEAELAYYRSLTLPQLQAEYDRAKRTTFDLECSDGYGMASVIAESRRIEGVIFDVMGEKK